MTTTAELRARQDAIRAMRMQLEIDDPVRTILGAAQDVVEQQWAAAYDAEKKARMAAERATAAAFRYEAELFAALAKIDGQIEDERAKGTAP